MHTPQVYVILADRLTGEVIRDLGPYANARAARIACGEIAGGPLTWIRAEEHWEAEQNGVLYRVPVDGE